MNRSRSSPYFAGTEYTLPVLSKLRVFDFSTIFFKAPPIYFVLTPAAISDLETGFPWAVTKAKIRSGCA